MISARMIEQIADAEFAIQGYFEDEPARPVPGAPATSDEIARLEAHLRKDGLACPPSYRLFLGLCNGIRGFKSGFSLLSVADVIQTPPDTFKRRYPTLARFIIGRGESLEFIALNPDNAHGEELEVVSVADDGNESRYASFGEYLQARLAQLQRALNLNQRGPKRKKR